MILASDSQISLNFTTMYTNKTNFYQVVPLYFIIIQKTNNNKNLLCHVLVIQSKKNQQLRLLVTNTV